MKYAVPAALVALVVMTWATRRAIQRTVMTRALIGAGLLSPES